MVAAKAHDYDSLGIGITPLAMELMRDHIRRPLRFRNQFQGVNPQRQAILPIA